MKMEEFVRRHIAHILLEQEDESKGTPTNVTVSPETEQTTGPGPGRYKKELAGLKALSDSDPMALMKNLGIKSATGDNKYEMLLDLLSQAVEGSDAMGNVYKDTHERQDRYGRKAVRVSLTGEMPVRDSLVFVRETLRGAKNAGILRFDDVLQSEIVGDSLLIYVSPKSFSWNKPKAQKKDVPAKQDKPTE